ncbi:hypothetical protein TNCV_3050031 [Trichonephila clavipes]|nr:hypothetical protein TNCV_3050031 [Trichonephila clavipes]
MMMIPAYNRRGALLSIRDGNPLQAKVQLLFPKKKQPCLTGDSNPNPFGYELRVLFTLLSGQQRTQFAHKLTYRLCRIGSICGDLGGPEGT